MKADEPGGERAAISTLLRGVRLDLVVAVCALLVSSLAMAAAWWQTRASLQQTQIIEEQLGAQVWPYVGVSEGIDNGHATRFSIENEGLGPAVLRSVVATVGGKPEGSFIEILHALLGPNVVARARRFHDDKLGLTISGASPGSVLRPGEAGIVYTFSSRHFARTLVHGYKRLQIRLCYCAIIPGRCWSATTSTTDPQPQPSCPEVAHDLLHEDGIAELGATF